MKPILEKFVIWFGSAGGVVQTFVIVVAAYIFEIADPKVDPHSLIFLAVLTLYSAITQPALAYVAIRASESSDAVLERIEELEKNIMNILLEKEQNKTTKEVESDQ